MEIMIPKNRLITGMALCPIENYSMERSGIYTALPTAASGDMPNLPIEAEVTPTSIPTSTP
jgi:hypothetical protein